jgi:hypothetical protein
MVGVGFFVWVSPTDPLQCRVESIASLMLSGDDAWTTLPANDLP